jgi:hypothetical protein
VIEKLDRLKVDAGSFKHEYLNRLWSILAVNVLIAQQKNPDNKKQVQEID